MDIKLNINNQVPGEEILFSNETDNRGWGYKERGLSNNDFSMTMNVSAFLQLSGDDLSVIQNWINNNLEFVIFKRRNEEIAAEKEYAKQAEARKAHYTKINEETKKEREKGFVYLLGSEIGKYKIGKTNNLEQRINHFSVKLPLKTWLVHSFKTDCYSKAENFLHSFYEKKQVTGEWFELSDDDVKQIKEIVDYGLDKTIENYQPRKVIKK